MIALYEASTSRGTVKEDVSVDIGVDQICAHANPSMYDI